MKTVKFASDLVPLILSGQKTATWRFNDDKNIQVGDDLEFKDAQSGVVFGHAKVLSVREKKIKDITDADYDEGHEKYANTDALIQSFKGYYGEGVSGESIIKLIKFELLFTPKSDIL